MKTNSKMMLGTVALITVLVISSYPLAAVADSSVASPGPVAAAGVVTSTPEVSTSYSLSDSFQVEIKAVLNEKVKDGTQLGSVIHMTNKTDKLIRVPEYELRVTKSDGVVYTLQPSTRNPSTLNPMASEDLSYFLTINHTDDFTLSDIKFVNVDVYSYPKIETLLLDVPIASQAWQGQDADFSNPASRKKWGESFTIPSQSSLLIYTPTYLYRDFNEATSVTVVQVFVQNPGSQRETVPDLAMDGKADKDVYSGKMIEQGPLVLEPGEKQYIHFAIPTELNTTLQSLNVLTVETFSSSVKGDQTYNVGRLNVLLPQRDADQPKPAADKYTWGEPLTLDPLNKIVHKDMKVSLVEMHIQQNDNDGFQTAVAKFNLNNNSNRPLPVPTFQSELVSTDGYIYTGYVQASVPSQVLPGGAYAVAYSFALPKSQTDDNLTLHLLDMQTIKPYKSVIGLINVNAQHEESKNNTELNLYPLKVKVKDWLVSSLITSAMTYNYRIKLNLDIQQDQQALLDLKSTKLQIDLLDDNGSIFASQANLGFIGTNNLISGDNYIYISPPTQQIQTPNVITMKIYESFTNANGETVKRLLAVYRQ